MSKLAKTLLAGTSFAPIILTYAFVSWICGARIINIVILLLIVAALVLICISLLKYAYKNIERERIKITAISTADGEVIGFVIAYLLPILSLTNPSIDIRVLLFSAFVFMVVIWTTNSYHINPLLNIVGYHFYEVSSDDNVTYLLLTKKELRKTKSVQLVIHLTEYMILDGGDE
jgi:hypothetical protein